MTEPESYSQWSAKNALDKDPIDALRDYTGYLRTEYLNRGELNEQVEQDIQSGIEEKLRTTGTLRDDNTEEELADLNTRLFAPKQNTLLDADLVSSYLALDDPDANEPSTKENAALLRKYASSLKFNPAGAAELEGAASELLQDSDLVRRARESAVDRGDLQAVGINNKDGGRDVYTGSNTFSDEDLPLVASSLTTNGALDTSDFLRLKNKMRRVHGGKATANEEQRLQEFNNALEVLSKTDLNVKNILGLASNVEAKKSAAEQETLAKRGGMLAWASLIENPLGLIAEGLGNIKSAVTGQDFESDFGPTDDEVLSEQLRKGDVTAEQLIAERLSDNEALRKRFSPEEIARYTRDIVTASTNYAFDAEKPETGIRELSTGAVVVAPALLAKPQLFEASLGKAALNEDQKTAARLQREASLDERAPQMLKLLTELDDDAASAFATAKQQGKTDRAFLEEWMSNEDNYSAFNNRLSSTGLSAWSGAKGFALGLAAFATGSETISKFAVESAANTAAQREKRKELASMFGDDYGLGQQIFEALPQVATDLALGFATAGAGAVAAKGIARAAIATAGRPAIMNTARAFAKQGIMSLDDVSFAAFRKATTAGGGVSTSDAIRAIGADWIKRASGDLATKILPVALPAFSRSTSNSYVSIYGGLPEGMSHEAKHKQALAGAVATGFATAAITVGMGRIGFGGPESLAVLGSKKTISDLTFREAKKVFEVVNNQGKAVSNAAFQKALAAEVGGAYKNLAAGVGKGVLGESFEEALDQSINIAIEDASLKRETPLAEKLQQVWNAALVGGAIGGGFSLGQQLAPISKSATTRALEARVSVLDGIAKRLSTSNAPETAASVQRMMDAANAAAVASTKKDAAAADAQAAKAPTTAVRTIEEGNELGFDDPRGVPPADTRIADLVGERVFIDGTDINGIAEIDADTGEVVINFSKPTKVKGKPNVTRYVLGRKYQKATGLSLKPKVKTLTKAVGSLPVGTRVFSANKMEFVLPTIEAVNKARAAGKPLLVLQRDENQRVVGVTIRGAALVARPTTTTDTTITDPELMREVLRLYPAPATPTGGFALESGEQLELNFNAPPEPELQQLLEDPNQLELDFEAEAPESTKTNLNALAVILAGDPVLNFLRTADPKRKGFAASVQQISDGEWSAAGDVLDAAYDFVAELGDSEPLLTKAALDTLGPILFKYDTGTTIRKRAAKQATTKSARRAQGARPTSPAPKAEAPPVAPTPTPAPLTPSQFTARAQNRAVDDIITQAGENSLSRWAAELPTITGFEPQAHGTSIDRAIDVVLNGVSSDQTFFTGPLVGREIAFTGAGVRTYGQAQVVMVGKGNNKIESVADIDYVVVNDNVAPDIELLREQYPQVEWLTIPEADTRYRATQPVVRLTPTPTPKPTAKKAARKAAKPEPAAEGAMQVLTDAEQLEIMALFASINNRINKGQILGGYSGNLSQVTPARDIRRLLAAKGYKESDTPKAWVDAASVDKGSPRDIEKLNALREWAFSGGKPAPETTAAEPQAPVPTREEIEDWLNEGGNAQTLVGATLLDKQGRSFKIEEVSIGDGGELEFVTDDPTTVTVPLTVGNLIDDTNPESFIPYLEAGNVEPEAGAPSAEPAAKVIAEKNKPVSPDDKRIAAPTAESNGMVVFERPNGTRYQLLDNSKTPEEYQNLNGRRVLIPGYDKSNETGGFSLAAKPQQRDSYNFNQETPTSDTVYTASDYTGRSFTISATELFNQGATITPKTTEPEAGVPAPTEEKPKLEKLSDFRGEATYKYGKWRISTKKMREYRYAGGTRKATNWTSWNAYSTDPADDPTKIITGTGGANFAAKELDKLDTKKAPEPEAVVAEPTAESDDALLDAYPTIAEIQRSGDPAVIRAAIRTEQRKQAIFQQGLDRVRKTLAEKEQQLPERQAKVDAAKKRVREAKAALKQAVKEERFDEAAAAKRKVGNEEYTLREAEARLALLDLEGARTYVSDYERYVETTKWMARHYEEVWAEENPDTPLYGPEPEAPTPEPSTPPVDPKFRKALSAYVESVDDAKTNLASPARAKALAKKGLDAGFIDQQTHDEAVREANDKGMDPDDRAQSAFDTLLGEAQDRLDTLDRQAGTLSMLAPQDPLRPVLTTIDGDGYLMRNDAIIPDDRGAGETLAGTELVRFPDGSLMLASDVRGKDVLLDRAGGYVVSLNQTKEGLVPMTLVQTTRVGERTTWRPTPALTPVIPTFSSGTLSMLAPQGAAVARHAELEAKHNAGTIKKREADEAQQLVDSEVRKQVDAALPLWKRLSALLPKIDPFNTTTTTYPTLTTDPDLFFSEGAHPQAAELARAAKMSDAEKLIFNQAAAAIRMVRQSPDYNRSLRQLGDEQSNIFKMASALKRMPLVELTEESIDDLEARAFLAEFQKDRQEVAAAATGEAVAVISALDALGQPTFTKSWEWPNTERFTGVPLDQRFGLQSPNTLQTLALPDSPALKQNIADIPAALQGMLPVGFTLAADPNMDGALGYNAVTDPTVVRYNPNLVGSLTVGLARADAMATLRTAVDHELGHAAAEEAFGQDGYEALAAELGEDMLTNIASIYYSLVEPDFNLRAERIKADRESGALPDWKIAAEWVRMEIERIANGRTSEQRMLFLRSRPSLLAKFIDALGAFVTRLRARFFEQPTTGTAASISNAARQLRKLKNGGYLPAAPKADPNALGDAAEFERALTGASDSTLFSLPIGAATKAGQAEIDGFWRRLGKRFENLPSYLKVEKEARDGIMAVATNQIEYFQKRVVRLLVKAPNVSLDDVRDVLGRTAPALDDAARARVRAELDVFINKLPADMDGVLAEEMIQDELYRLQRVERIASNTAFAQQQADAQQRIRNAGYDELADLLVKFRKDIDNMSERFKHLNTSIDDNLGVYLTRTFDFFTTEGWSLMASNKGVMPDGTQLAMFRGKEVDFNKLRDNAAKAYEADVVAEAQRRGEVATAEEIQERTHEKLDKYLAALQRSTEQYAGTNTDSIKKDIKRFLPKRDLDNAVLDLLGVIEDPIENAMRTMANVAKIAANDRFLSGARSTLLSMGLASNKPDAKNSTPAFGKRYADAALDPLEGLYTTPEIARALQAEFGEGARRIDSTTDTLMQDVGTWVRHGAAFATTMKTLPSVGFHARNMVSGQLLLTTAQGVAPANKHTLKAFKLSFLANFESRKRTPEEAAEIERLIELQMLRDDTSARALKDMTRGFEFSSEQELDSLFLAYQEAASGNPGALKAIFKKAGVRYDKTIDILASLNNVTDGAVKVQAYYTNLEVLKADKKQQLAQEAADPEQRLLRTLELKAADKTKLCTPTHSRRFDWVKSMNKTSAGLILFPFAGWKTEVFRTMYNIPRLAYKEITQGEGPAERAMGVKRLVGWTTVMFAAGKAMGFLYQTIFSALAGLGDEEDRFTGRELTPEELFALRESMPEWQKGHDVFTRLTESGVMVIDMTAITPYAQLTDMGNIILEGIQTGEGPSGRKVASYVVNQLIGMQIAAKTASEIWPQNQNDFGQPIYRENDDAAQVFGKSMLHYMEGAMEPAISAFVRKVTRTGEQDVKEMIVGEFTGARPRIQKLSEIEYRAFRGVKKMLDDSAQIKSSLVTGRKLGDDEVEQTLLEHQEALNRTQRKLAKTIEGLKGLGSTRGSIFGSAKNAGFSAQRVELAEQGRNYRWTPNQAWLKGVYQNMTRTGEDDPMNRINAIRRTLSGQPAVFNVVE